MQKDIKMQYLLEQLAVEYPNEINQINEINEEFLSNDNKVNEYFDDSNLTNSVSKPYFDYIKILIVKILLLIVFVIWVLVFFSIFTDYNFIKILKDIIFRK